MTGTSAFKKFRNGLIFPSLVLGCIALIAAATLSGGDFLTKDAIRQRQAEDLKASINQVMPSDMYDNKLLDDTVTIPNASGELVLVYRAWRGNTPAGVVFQETEPGYAGDILIIMGVAVDGTLMGVRVLSHAETPGLGDRIEEAKDNWIFGFEGLSLDNPPPEAWSVKKDGGYFDQFSGATITPRKVVKAVKRGLEFFAANRNQLFTEREETNE